MGYLEARMSNTLRPQSSIAHRIIAGITRHLQQGIGSIGELWRTPFTTVMTILVLGISLTLPATLHLFVKNAKYITEQWDSAAQISLYLKSNVSAKQAEALQQKLQNNSKIAEVVYISPDQGLEDFKQLSGLGDALAYLDKNPLPATMVIIPTKIASSSEQAAALLTELLKLNEVEQGKLDLEWLTRLEAIASLVRGMVIGIATLLCLSVVLIIGNTIRLAILNQRDAIAVMKLVGATDAFIQRPFLYAGAWYGVLGGIIACICVSILMGYFSFALAELTQLYQSQFKLHGLAFHEVFTIIFAAVLLGLSGSYLSVRKHIRAIEPTAD